jgi:hypothetical protein
MAGPKLFGIVPNQKVQHLMDIETAQKALGVDRVLIIGLMLFLHDKGVIKSTADMDLLIGNCRSTLNHWKDLRNPVISVQLERTEAELEHFFLSFNLPDRQQAR